MCEGNATSVDIKKLSDVRMGHRKSSGLSYCFKRGIHKGFLVNQAAIKLLGAEEIELTSGIRLPVGKTYSDSVKQQFMRYLRS